MPRGGRARLSLLALLLGVLSGPAAAAETVRAGLYVYPVFAEFGSSGEISGLSSALMEALNAAQDDYEFTPVITSPVRRFEDFGSGRFDVVFFESPKWGWAERDLPLTATGEIMSVAEVYIARAEPGRGQEFFSPDTLPTRHFVGILGYHYAFADSVTDPEVLTRRFDITLVNTPRAVVDLVRAGRADVGVVSDVFLQQFLSEVPEARGDLLVSDRPDRVYSLPALVRDGAPITAEALDAMLAALKADGTLDALKRAQGLTVATD